MHQYQYQHGDKPLAGYTIERAAGRGGFGEVYYAVSDSGRQVALKTVQNYEQIELRGIKQCMNLKNPHLVTIFDVKYNDKGRPFVIMEFVSGMNLRDLLDEHPQGIGTQKAAFFLREIAKGLSYLHESGIVHRDLKPGNIFYENGMVKIGDYGLTKAINHTQHSAQTITVGTVHYMAPEIGEGKYDFSIDIYALGVLLYEMLTGQVPFFGASPGEILMKHMAHEPDLTGIDPTFTKVIKKALAKDPSQRYQTVKEMIEDVFGAEHIQHSVSQFAPESLSIIADRVARKAQTASPPPPPNIAPPKPGSTSMSEKGERIGRRLGEATEQFNQRISHAAVKLDEHLKAPNTGVDPIETKQRWILTIVTVGIIALTGGLFSGGERVIPSLFLVIYGTAYGITYARFRALKNMEPGGTRKFLTSIMGIALGALLILPTQPDRIHGIEGSLLLFAIYILLTDWWKLSKMDRKERIDWGPVVWGAVIGFFLAGIFDGNSALAASMIAGTLLAVQVASPFGVASNKQPHTATRRPSMGEHVSQRFRDFKERVSQPYSPSHSDVTSSNSSKPIRRPIPSWLRALFFVGTVLLLGIGLFLLIMAGTSAHGFDFTVAVAVGVNALLLSLFCLIRGSFTTMKGWFSYLIKPCLMHLCLTTVVFSSIVMGCEGPDDEEFAVCLFFIIFPTLLFFVMLFVPSSLFERRITPDTGHSSTSPRNRLLALLLASPLVVFAGIHRFYVGKIGTGFLWLVTFGLFGIGQLIDIILILAGGFRDAEDRLLVDWVSPSSSTQPQTPHRSENRQTAQEHAPVQSEGSLDLGEGPEVPPPSAPKSSMTVSTSSTYRSSAFLTAYERINPVGTLLALLGYVLILASVIVALVAGSHLSSYVAAGLPDPEIHRNLTEVFGDEDWPQVVDRIGMLVSALALFVALILVTMGRRRAGGSHILRAVLGIALLAWVVSMIPHWSPQLADPGIVALFETGKIGPAINGLLIRFDDARVTRTVLLGVAAVFLLVWPAKRKTTTIESLQPAQGVN